MIGTAPRAELTIALLTESADGNARLLSAHHQVRVMLRHRSLNVDFLAQANDWRHCSKVIKAAHGL